MESWIWWFWSTLEVPGRQYDHKMSLETPRNGPLSIWESYSEAQRRNRQLYNFQFRSQNSCSLEISSSLSWLPSVGFIDDCWSMQLIHDVPEHKNNSDYRYECSSTKKSPFLGSKWYKLCILVNLHPQRVEAYLLPGYCSKVTSDYADLQKNVIHVA